MTFLKPLHLNFTNVYYLAYPVPYRKPNYLFRFFVTSFYILHIDFHTFYFFTLPWPLPNNQAPGQYKPLIPSHRPCMKYLFSSVKPN